MGWQRSMRRCWSWKLSTTTTTRDSCSQIRNRWKPDNDRTWSHSSRKPSSIHHRCHWDHRWRCRTWNHTGRLDEERSYLKRWQTGLGQSRIQYRYNPMYNLYHSEQRCCRNSLYPIISRVQESQMAIKHGSSPYWEQQTPW